MYHFGNVRLINVAVTADCSRLIAIGPSVPPADGPQPTRQTKVEKRFIGMRVFNCLCPILTEMDSIQYAYETKGGVRLDTTFAKRRLYLYLDSQTPLFDDVRDIVISKMMSVILVSFEQVRPCHRPSRSRLTSHISPLSSLRHHLNSGNWRSCGTEHGRTKQAPLQHG